jgi:hypothetical protein
MLLNVTLRLQHISQQIFLLNLNYFSLLRIDRFQHSLVSIGCKNIALAPQE